MGLSPRCLGSLAVACAVAGNQERAAALAVQAELGMARIDRVEQVAAAWALTARAYAAAGDNAVVAAFAALADRAVAGREDAEVRALLAKEVLQSLAAAGASAEAERRALLLPDPWDRFVALHTVAGARAAAADLPRAAGTAAAVERAARAFGDGAQVGTLCRAAQVWLQVGDRSRASRLLDEAEATAFHEADPERLARLLWPVVDTWAEMGEADRAADGLARIDRAVRTATPAEILAEHLCRSAPAWAAVAEADRAVAAAEEAEGLLLVDTGDPLHMVPRLCQAAATWRQVGRPDRSGELYTRAERLASQLATPLHSAYVLQLMAQGNANLGDAARAVHLALEAERHAMAIDDPALRTQLLSEIVSVLGKAGAAVERDRCACGLEEALGSATTIPDERLAALAASLAAAGAVESATRTAYRIDAGLYRAEAFASVTRAAAAAGAEPGAAAAAQEVMKPAKHATDPWSRIALLRAVTAWSDAAGEHAARAAVMAERTLAGGGEPHPHAFAHVAAELARGGLLDRAEALLRNIDAPKARNTAFTEATLTLAAAGRTTAAERMCAQTVGAAPRARALAELARAWAARGEVERAAAAVDQAERLARSVPGPAGQARALLAIAVARAALGGPSATQPQHAERLLCEALALSDPLTALAALARLRPDAATLVVAAWEQDVTDSENA